MISEIIQCRRAVFPEQFNDQPISKKEIERILKAANWAPTHKRTEPWRFKVFHGTSQVALGKFLSETYKKTTENFSERKYQKFMEKSIKAGCVLAICFQRDPKGRLPEWEEIASTAMAVQNMWLTASEMKIGAYWSSPGVVKYMGQFVEMNEGERCIGLFFLGKYDGELPEGTRKTPIEEKTVWV